MRKGRVPHRETRHGACNSGGMSKLLLIAGLALFTSAAEAGPSVSSGTNDRHLANGCPYSERAGGIIAGDFQRDEEEGIAEDGSYQRSRMGMERDAGQAEGDCATFTR